MNKKIVIIVSVILTVILASAAYLLLTTNDSEEKVQTSSAISSNAPSQESNPVDSAPTSSTKPGVYLDYSESELVNRSDTTRLLSFHAPWCPQCRSLDEDIKANALPTGVTIFKVDYDSNQDLRKKYGVTVQTTVVRIDANGNLVEKYVAYDEPTFANVKANLL